jgi:hypothetical protein
MAKAVVPTDKFRAKFGELSHAGIAARLGDLVEEFILESADIQPAAT